MIYDDTNARDYAVTARDKNVLVSAAAGSGKTYTLVKRITEMLEKEPDKSVDRMLVVTFTRAAAQELKDRIVSALNEAIVKPENASQVERLEREKTLVRTACMGTIDSFCNDICKKYFTELKLDPNYEVDDTRVKLLQKKVTEDVLEEYYGDVTSEDYKTIREIVDVVCTIADDDDLREGVIANVLSYATNTVDPIAWIESLPEKYDDVDFWYNYIKSELNILTDETIKHINACIELVKNELYDILSKPDKDIESYEKDIEVFENFKKILNSDDGLFKVSPVKYERFNGKSGSPESKEAHDALVLNNEYRPTFNKNIEKLIGNVDGLTVEERKMSFYDGTFAMKKYVKLLSEICVKIYEGTLEKCREENVFNFSQIEHFALEALEIDEIRNNFREKFDEVYVDEYQDTNMIQEEIVTRVSRLPEKQNMFMVGDVKQSIYEFRRATPEFFMKKYNAYKEDESKGVLRNFTKNFRSRNEVLQGVNAIFNVVMTKATCGIDYSDGHSLNYGAVEKFGPLATDEKTGEDVPSEANKCEFLLAEEEEKAIANRILKLFDEKFNVGGVPVKFSDICIICRRNKDIAKLRKYLSEFGFPVDAGNRDSLLLRHEVQCLLNYLSIVDNPFQDIPVYTVLKSRFYKMTDNQIAKVRLEGKRYDSLYECTKKSTECLSFIRDLTYFRERAQKAPVSDVCWELAMHNSFYNRLSDSERENVRRFIALAAAFDDGLKGGLYGFLRYIYDVIRIDEEGKKSTPTFTASGAEPCDNSIKFMTIHGSKGLEFPVVILAYSYSDGKGYPPAAYIDEKLGVGISFMNEKQSKLEKSAPMLALRYKTGVGSKQEMQRDLYVALTRAREKLIVTGNKPNNYVSMRENNYRLVPSAAAIKRIVCFENLVAYGALQPGAEKYWNVFIGDESGEESFAEKVNAILHKAVAGDDGVVLKDDVSYVYVPSDDKIEGVPELPLKLSVSALKHYAEEEDAVYVKGKGTLEKIELSSCDEEKKKGGTEFGTEVHRALERMIEDRKNWPEGDEISVYVKSFANDENAALLEKFLKSERAKKIKEAQFVKTETPFTAKLDIEKYLKDYAGEIKTVAIQGVIDLYYKAMEGICIVDFKTDRTANPESYDKTESYKSQISCYRDALEKITGEKVVECVLYFLRSEKEILV